MAKFKTNTTTILVVILIGLLFISFLNISWERKEGFYNNNTLYYTGCNPLLYTQSPGCSGCGKKVDSCWRESTLCGIDKPCY
jgi:hypothetical protein